MKERYFGFIFIFLFPILLAGCGGGAGAPGSSGSADTGIIIQADSVTVSSPDIDTHIHICPSGQPEPGLFRESATLNVTAAPLNTSTASDPFPASIEQCTVTYEKANEDPAAPIIEAFTQYPNCELVSGTNSCDLTLIDIQRKVDFWNAIVGVTNTPATRPVHYVAVFNCSYTNAFGKTGNFQTELDIWLDDFNKC
jgi:hypothetical protein